MTMLAPKLRHRVDIEEFTESQDSETGAIVQDWASILTGPEPAEIVPLSGREFVAAQSTQAGVTTRITIRWRTDVKPAMRVVHEGAFYNIRAVLPDSTLRRHITLMCETGVNLG